MGIACLYLCKDRLARRGDVSPMTIDEVLEDGRPGENAPWFGVRLKIPREVCLFPFFDFYLEGGRTVIRRPEIRRYGGRVAIPYRAEVR
jgi:hypothetical protein